MNSDAASAAVMNPSLTFLPPVEVDPLASPELALSLSAQPPRAPPVAAATPTQPARRRNLRRAIAMSFIHRLPMSTMEELVDGLRPVPLSLFGTAAGLTRFTFFGEPLPGGPGTTW